MGQQPQRHPKINTWRGLNQRLLNCSETINSTLSGAPSETARCIADASTVNSVHKVPRIPPRAE